MYVCDVHTCVCLCVCLCVWRGWGGLWLCLCDVLYTPRCAGGCLDVMYINGVWMGVYEIIYIHRCMDVYQCVVYIHSWVGGCMSVYGVCGGGGGC